MDISVSMRLQGLQSKHSYLFWKIKPEGFKIIQDRDANEYEGLEISLKTGTLETQSRLEECVIRELKGEAEDILYLMKNELKTLMLIRDYSYFDEIFGFYNEESINGKLIYVLVYKNYKYTLAESFNLSLELKCELMTQIIEGYEVIFELNRYHGNISPFNIHLNDLYNIKIGGLLTSGSITKFVPIDYKKSLKFLKLVDFEYSSPEIKLTQCLFSKNIILDAFNPTSSDLFSLGLTLLSMFNPQVSLPSIDLRDQNLEIYNGRTINKSLNSLLIGYLNAKNYDLLYDQIKLQESYIEQCILKANLKNICFVRTVIRTFYAERDTFQDFKTAFTSLFITDNIFYTPPIDLSFQVSHPYDEFIDLMDTIDSPNIRGVSSALEDMIASAMETSSAEIDRLIDSYFSKSIKTPIDMHEGLALFLDTFYHKLLKTETLTLFISMLRKRNGLCNYNTLIPQILSLTDEIIKDLYITAIGFLNFDKNHWFYFFPSDKSVMKYTSYIQFSSVGKLIEEFKGILSNPQIYSLIISLFPRDVPFMQYFDVEIADDIFLVDLPLGLCGCVSSNHNIFIKLIKNKGKVFECPIVRASIYIILLHELAHLLRRIGARTRHEHFTNITPPSNFKFSEETRRKSERIQLLNTKGEAGFEMEINIFGTVITKLNLEAAEAIINIGNEPLEQFQPRLMDMLENYSSPVIELHRDNEGLQLGQCLMRYTDSFHTIVKHIEF